MFITMTTCSYAARGSVTEYTNAQAWKQATEGQYSTIAFTGFFDGTSISNQYQNIGITFESLSFIFMSAGFVNDGWGLHGPGGLHIDFSAPQYWVAIDHPGVAQFELYNQGTLIYTSSLFFHGGFGNFSGLVSNTPFDEVYIFKPPPYENQVAIDDLHWGSSVPAPGAFALMAIGALRARRRRRA